MAKNKLKNLNEPPQSKRLVVRAFVRYVPFLVSMYYAMSFLNSFLIMSAEPKPFAAFFSAIALTATFSSLSMAASNTFSPGVAKNRFQDVGIRLFFGAVLLSIALVLIFSSQKMTFQKYSNPHSARDCAVFALGLFSDIFKIFIILTSIYFIYSGTKTISSAMDDLMHILWIQNNTGKESDYFILDEVKRLRAKPVEQAAPPQGKVTPKSSAQDERRRIT